MLLVCAVAYSQSKTEKLLSAYKDDMKNNRYEAALKKIDKLMQTEEDKYSLLCDKGICFYYLKKYQLAFDSYSDAIAFKKDSSRAYYLRGLFYLSAEKEQNAIQDFSYALKFSNDTMFKLSCYINRASAKINLRNFESAYKDLIKGYELDSNNLGILNNLALVCDHVGKGDLTLVYLYRIIEIDSLSEFALSNIGFKLQQDGKYIESIPYFTKCIGIAKNMEQGIPYCNRAYSYLQLGKINEALSDIRKSIGIYPENSYAYVVFAEINIAQKDYRKACDNLTIALQKNYTKKYGDKAVQLENQYCK